VSRRVGSVSGDREPPGTRAQKCRNMSLSSVSRRLSHPHCLIRLRSSPGGTPERQYRASRKNTSGTDADLRGADLRGADLCKADLDMSCLPLWCGSLNMKVDKRIAAQIMYHACALDCDDPKYREVRSKCLAFANQMHRIDVPRLV